MVIFIFHAMVILILTVLPAFSTTRTVSAYMIFSKNGKICSTKLYSMLPSLLVKDGFTFNASERWLQSNEYCAHIRGKKVLIE